MSSHVQRQGSPRSRAAARARRLRAPLHRCRGDRGHPERRRLRHPELSDAVVRTEHVVPGDPPVPVRVHRPVTAEGRLPAVVTIHGGGYVIGSYDMDDPLLDRWCPGLGVVGVSVEYRLAPETPYPGPMEDCYAALRWTYDNADELGVDKDRIGIYGLSAGGGLAAALALLARDRGEVPLAFQLLDCPMLDDRQQTPSIRADGLYVWGARVERVRLALLPRRSLRLRRGPGLRRRGPGDRPGRAPTDVRDRRLDRRLPRRGHRLRPAPEPGRGVLRAPRHRRACPTRTCSCPAPPAVRLAMHCMDDWLARQLARLGGD